MATRRAVRPQRVKRRPARIVRHGKHHGVAEKSATVANAGNVATWPKIQVTGPTTGFYVRLGSQVVHVSYPVPSGQVFVLDFATRQATLDGTAISTLVYTAGSDFFQLQPGNNTVAHSLTSLIVKHRAAYR